MRKSSRFPVTSPAIASVQKLPHTHGLGTLSRHIVTFIHQTRRLVQGCEINHLASTAHSTPYPQLCPGKKRPGEQTNALYPSLEVGEINRETIIVDNCATRIFVVPTTRRYRPDAKSFRDDVAIIQGSQGH